MRPAQFLQDAMLARRNTLYPNGVINYVADPDLAVIDCELVERACGKGTTSNYVVTLDNGKKHKLARVSSFVRRWNRQEYSGSSSASQIGTEVHQAIAMCFAGNWRKATEHLSNPYSHKCFAQFLAWWEQRCENSLPLLSEARVWSIDLGLAGTVDLVLDGPFGPEVIDFKTGSEIDPTYALQCRLYELCLEKLGVKVARSALVMLPRDGTGPKEVELWAPTGYERSHIAGSTLAMFKLIEENWPKLIP